jgi:hypothetical protein
MLSEDKPTIFINKGAGSAGILFYVPEMGIVQSQ